MLLDKITLDDIRPSSRKYPFIAFKPERELGKDVLFVESLSQDHRRRGAVRGSALHVGARREARRHRQRPGAASTLFQILAGEVEPDAGEVRWGRSVNLGYFPKDNAAFFDSDLNLVEWLRQREPEPGRDLRPRLPRPHALLGRSHKKSARVLSGGERVRCMLSRMMLQDPNVLLLDGPTNHLDLESITALNNGLLKFAGSMVVRSHDVQFVDSLVTRVLELAGEELLRPRDELRGVSRRPGPAGARRDVGRPRRLIVFSPAIRDRVAACTIAFHCQMKKMLGQLDDVARRGRGPREGERVRPERPRRVALGPGSVFVRAAGPGGLRHGEARDVAPHREGCPEPSRYRDDARRAAGADSLRDRVSRGRLGGGLCREPRPASSRRRAGKARS